MEDVTENTTGEKPGHIICIHNIRINLDSRKLKVGVSFLGILYMEATHVLKLLYRCYMSKQVEGLMCNCCTLRGFIIRKKVTNWNQIVISCCNQL